MLIEAESIPYEPAQLRGERLLVLAPHPDDEAIACGGLIALHLRERRAVRVVVATDGAEQGNASLREEESRRGLARLGNAEIDFLRFGDRSLGDDAAARIREELLAFRPDLVLVPSPVEIHPDHFALSRIFCELVQREETLFTARVAFYEVGQPLRPNALVDISDVAELKWAAIAEHQSQLAERDYAAYARGLNAYRAMTLPATTTFAEGYYVVELRELRTKAFSELRRELGAPRDLEVVAETVPISVVIRTKDRPELLREAIESVRATGYPCEIVVVNDGGVAPTSGAAGFSLPKGFSLPTEPGGLKPAAPAVTLVHHEQSRGRSEAANSGVRAASHAFIAFLDDDDLFYREHLSTLATASKTPHAAWYTDAVSAFLRPGENGAYETRSRLRLFAQDFDRELLLLDNYIPLPSLLIPRDAFLDLGGFDPAFDLFEDWDFLIRLAQRGTLLRIPRVTCEIRHFEGGSSVILAAPEGSERFRKAKLQIWQKHAALIDNDVIANVFERQKRRASTLYSDSVEAKGRAEAAETEIARASREAVSRQDDLNGYMLRVRELEGSLTALQALVPLLDERAMTIEQLRHALADAATQRESLEQQIADLRAVNTSASVDIARLRVEIDRLNGLLEMIYRSRTWKLHTLAQKLKGRG